VHNNQCLTKMKLLMPSLMRKMMIAFNCRGVLVNLVYFLQGCVGISNAIPKIVTFLIVLCLIVLCRINS